MKVCLLVAVCFTIAAVADDTLNQQLLRVLANLEKKNLNDNQVQSAVESSPITAEYKPAPITVQEFKETLEGWEEISQQFIAKVNDLKPLALQSLTRRKSWDEVAVKSEEVFGHAAALYGKIMGEALETSHRLFENAKGFGRSGRCSTMARLAEGFDASDALAEIRSTEALVSDLDCFSGEIEDTISALSVMCADGAHFGADEALGMIARVMQTLYRFRHDGQAFGLGAMAIEDKYKEVYAKRDDTPMKRLLSKYLQKND